ncbi:MAG: hypothetical protein SFZ03_01735 [Candidatus Melainabacteria bacterium]|nr:hypothetical protein [Candidatus Melainabacteria bacterium]
MAFAPVSLSARAWLSVQSTVVPERSRFGQALIPEPVIPEPVRPESTPPEPVAPEPVLPKPANLPPQEAVLPMGTLGKDTLTLSPPSMVPEVIASSPKTDATLLPEPGLPAPETLLIPTETNQTAQATPSSGNATSPFALTSGTFSQRLFSTANRLNWKPDSLQNTTQAMRGWLQTQTGGLTPMQLALLTASDPEWPLFKALGSSLQQVPLPVLPVVGEWMEQTVTGPMAMVRQLPV